MSPNLLLILNKSYTSGRNSNISVQIFFIYSSLLNSPPPPESPFCMLIRSTHICLEELLKYVISALVCNPNISGELNVGRDELNVC